MKRLAVALALLSFAGTLPPAKQAAFFPNVVPTTGGGGSPTAVKIFQTGANGTAGGCTTAPATNTTSATLFISCLHGYRSPYPAASSSPANTWTALTGVGSGGAGAIISYVSSPTTSSSQTFSANGGDVGTQFSNIGTIGFSGITTLGGSSSGNFATGNTIQPGSLTPSVGGSVFITECAYDFSTETLSIDSGFTIWFQGVNSGGTGFAVAYKIKTSGDTSAENPTWTATGSANPSMSTVMSYFK